MSVYKELGSTIFGDEELKKITNGEGVEPIAFEEKLAAVVEKYTGTKDTLMKVRKASPDKIDHESTDTFVTTVQSSGAVGVEPYRLRSYTTPAGGVDSILNHDWTIFEAVRAASALPAYLKPFTIGTHLFQDASTSKVANPVLEAISEVELRWTNKVEPVIISLGTGLVSLIPINPNVNYEPEQRRKSLLDKILRIFKKKTKKTMVWSDEFAKQLARVAQDTEMVHQEVLKRLKRMELNDNYFRFNPTVGLGDINFSDIAQAGRIMEFTNLWLDSPEGRDMAERVYRALRPPSIPCPRTESDYESDDDDDEL
ncbi:FabD/lysophospholipase-like protein [Phlegmacium glaucopus]|nr:FabD/lysophospholipase-like protein [Phlegmacium glaucopus]